MALRHLCLGLTLVLGCASALTRAEGVDDEHPRRIWIGTGPLSGPGVAGAAGGEQASTDALQPDDPSDTSNDDELRERRREFERRLMFVNERDWQVGVDADRAVGVMVRRRFK